MKIRRTLATAVALAATAPAVLLAAGPAFADAAPASASSSARTEDKPSAAGLERAVAEARKAYEDAVAAESAAHQALEDVLCGASPLTVAADRARQKAEDAATAKTAAHRAVADAQAHVGAVMGDDDASDDDRGATLRALGEAQKAADAADAAKTAADAAYADAIRARDDARAEAARAYGVAQKATKDAKAALDAAEKALAAASEGAGDDESCAAEPDLAVSVSGLPGRIAAGTTVDFSIRLTNRTRRTLDEVRPYVAVHATGTKGERDLDGLLRLRWSSAASPAWKSLGRDGYAGAVGPLKAGARADVALRLTVGSGAPAGEGVALTAGDYVNHDGSCGGTPDSTVRTFELVAAGSASGGGAGPATSTTPRTPGATPQGGTSVVPVSATTTRTGTLAATGAPSALPQLALASGAAVVLGAGTTVLARRRSARSGV
ncbi:peptidase [Streptomyces sp. MUM 2J]|uniref:peptidase n=1 Tax=Streptomyces sp. MUM 2J TaxID=2791987 RepID=UPI001F033B5C|nr:peptidase [Streptomyces sp. MUM 2J]MCH0567325.1 peptidase [Streptomyces sp. MUM 2J]